MSKILMEYAQLLDKLWATSVIACIQQKKLFSSGFWYNQTNSNLVSIWLQVQAKYYTLKHSIR